MELPVRQYPVTQNAVVTISTAYYGASPETIAGFITTPLENAIAQADGIDYMTSSSIQGVSTITVNLRLNYDANKALSQIITQVNSVTQPDAAAGAAVGDQHRGRHTRSTRCTSPSTARSCRPTRSRTI